MTTTTAAQLEGRRRVDALRRRAHRIRVRIACGAAVTFMALFSGIYIQMAGGHDPTLGSGSTVVATSTESTAADDSVTSSAGSSSSSSSDTTSQQVAPVTTQQS